MFIQLSARTNNAQLNNCMYSFKNRSLNDLRFWNQWVKSPEYDSSQIKSVVLNSAEQALDTAFVSPSRHLIQPLCPQAGTRYSLICVPEQAPDTASAEQAPDTAFVSPSRHQIQPLPSRHQIQPLPSRH